MSTPRRIALSIGIIFACNRDAAPTTARQPATTAQQTLAEARRGFTPKKVQREPGDPVPNPPLDEFRVVLYPAAVGDLPAYITPAPRDGKRHPAIVWITGGDCNTIGDVWTPQPREDDQTARQYRDAGFVMMFPSLRGGNDNPSAREGFLGEVDDVIAAGEFLRKLEHVDPDRIYLGGHSTGGTLALLVAESTDRFRAVFSFGPVHKIDMYPLEEWPTIDPVNDKGIELRSPLHWLHGIRVPVFVIEGAEEGNALALDVFETVSSNPLVHLLTIPGADHFDVLAPANEVIVKKLLADTGDVGNVSISEQEIVERHRPK